VEDLLPTLTAYRAEPTPKLLDLDET
jgi:hypothetical protein